MGPLKLSVQEAKLPFGQNLLATPPPGFCSGSNELGPREDVSSGPDCPRGFEFLIGDDELSSEVHTQIKAMGSLDCGNSLQNGNETDESLGVFHGFSPDSIEKVPQTLLFESGPIVQSGIIEIVLPFEEKLVEAQKSWNIGKAWRITVSNELAMIDALAKVKEC